MAFFFNAVRPRNFERRTIFQSMFGSYNTVVARAARHWLSARFIIMHNSPKDVPYTCHFADRSSTRSRNSAWRAVEIQQHELDENTFLYMNWLALAYATAGEFRKTEAVFREMVESMEEKRGIKPSPFCSAIRSHLVGTYIRLGRYDEAESLFDESLEAMQKRTNDDHPGLLRAKSHLGVLLWRTRPPRRCGETAR